MQKSAALCIAVILQIFKPTSAKPGLIPAFPRARYVHNAIGLSANELIIVQREGTIEEIGAALRDAGADQGIILDNGGVACWAWWVNAYAGGSFRRPSTIGPQGHQ